MYIYIYIHIYAHSAHVKNICIRLCIYAYTYIQLDVCNYLLILKSQSTQPGTSAIIVWRIIGIGQSF